MSSNSRFAVAVHTLTFLGCAGERPLPVTSDELAWSANTHPVVIRRVLGSLREAGLVTSQAGPGGGWRLGSPPREISLRQVYGAVADEPLFALPPRPGRADCAVGGHVQALFDRLFGGAEAALGDYLATVSVADLVDELAAALGPCPDRRANPPDGAVPDLPG